MVRIPDSSKGISETITETHFEQVHAEASNFAFDLTKEEAYKQVLESVEVLLEGQRNWVSYE